MDIMWWNINSHKKTCPYKELGTLSSITDAHKKEEIIYNMVLLDVGFSVDQGNSFPHYCSYKWKLYIKKKEIFRADVIPFFTLPVPAFKKTNNQNKRWKCGPLINQSMNSVAYATKVSWIKRWLRRTFTFEWRLYK